MKKLIIFKLFVFAFTLAFSLGSVAEKPVVAPDPELNVKKSQLAELPELEKAPEQKVKGKIEQPKVTQFSKEPLEVEKRIEKAVDKEISELESLIKKYGSTGKRGKLWLLLAETYREKSRLMGFRLQDDHSRKMKSWKSSQNSARPVFSLKPAFSYNLKAVSLYKSFLKEFASDQRAPMAYYLMGYNYLEADRTSEGIQAYKVVIQKYSNSAHSHHARLQLAEYYFEKRQWAQSKALYKKVIDADETTNKLIGQYKYSWCQYHQGLNSLSLTGMKQVYEQLENNQDVNIGLRDEVRKGLIFIYAQSNQYKEAFQFLSKIETAQELRKSLIRLGKFYIDKGNFPAGQFLYGKVLEKNPNHLRAAYLEYDLFAGNSGWKNPSTYHGLISNWIKKYNSKSTWAKNNISSQSKVNQFLEGKSLAWAMTNHRGLQFRTPGVTVDMTMKSYELFFKYFSNSKKANSLHFYYGDLLFDAEKYDLAAIHFGKVLRDKESKNYSDALLNRVLARNKSLPSQKVLQKANKESKRPIPFTKAMKKFRLAAKQYLKQQPRGDIATKIQYRLALLYYVNKQWPRAESGFNTVIATAPKTQFAKHSAHLLLDIYNTQGDYSTFVKVGKKLIQNKDVGDQETQAEMTAMVRKASFTEAQKANESGELAKATTLFLAFVSENPNTPLSGLAHYNIATNYQKEGKYIKAISHFEQSLTFDERKKYELSAQRELAPLYKKLGQFEEAAAQYESLSEITKNPKKSAGLNVISGAIWLSINKFNRAHKNFGKAIGLDSHREKEVLSLQAEGYADQNNLVKSRGYYSLLISKFGKDEPKNCLWKLKLAQNYRDSGRQAQYNKGLNDVISCHAKLSQSNQKKWAKVGANAKYVLARKDFAKLKRNSDVMDLKRRQQLLEKKLKQLAKLDKDFQNIIEMNVSEYIVKSLASLGEANLLIADFVRNTPAPKNLPVESLKDYQTQVAGIISKMEGDSRKYYELAGQKAAQFHVVYQAQEMEKTKSLLMFTNQNLSIFPESLDSKYSDYKTAVLNNNKAQVKTQAQILLEQNSEDAIVLNGLSTFYRKNNQLKLSENLANIVLKKDSANTKAMVNLAEVYFVKKETTAGLQTLVKARANESSNTKLENKIANIYLIHGQHEAVVGLLDSSLKNRSQAWEFVAIFTNSLISVKEFEKSLNILRTHVKIRNLKKLIADKTGQHLIENYFDVLETMPSPIEKEKPVLERLAKETNYPQFSNRARKIIDSKKKVADNE